MFPLVLQSRHVWQLLRTGATPTSLQRMFGTNYLKCTLPCHGITRPYSQKPPKMIKMRVEE